MHWYLILSHAIAIGLGWFGHKRFGAKVTAEKVQLGAKLQGGIGQVKADVKKDL